MSDHFVSGVCYCEGCEANKKKWPERAYPVRGDVKDESTGTYFMHELGLTKREWFAGMATEDDIKWHQGNYHAQTGGKPISREEARFRYADAMIEASKQEKTNA